MSLAAARHDQPYQAAAQHAHSHSLVSRLPIIIQGAGSTLLRPVLEVGDELVNCLVRLGMSNHL
jgi:hypothetical protein